MVLSSNIQEVALQAEADVRSFRDVFDLHSVNFGSPDDLAGFLKKLKADSSFSSNLWALTRSIRSREKGYLTDEDLCTLILIAVAGSNLSAPSRQVRKLLTELEDLIATRSKSPIEERLQQVPQASPPAPGKADRNQPSVDSRLSALSAVQAQGHCYKHVTLASAAVLLCVSTAWVGNTMSRHRRSQRTSGSVEASANKIVADPVRVSAATRKNSVDLPPAPINYARPGGSTLPIPTPAAGDPQPANFQKTSALESAPIHHVPSAARLPLAAKGKSPVTHYAVGKSHSVALSSGVMGANLLESHPPSYPRLASLTRVQGPVVLQAVVSDLGTVESVHVIKGPHLLRGAASNAVRTWRYKPYMLNGNPVEVATIVTVDFALQNKN